MINQELVEKFIRALRDGDEDTMEALIEYEMKYDDSYDTLAEFKRILEDGGPAELIKKLTR